MPTPMSDESRDEFVERCVPIVIEDGTADGDEQAAAVCHSMWEQHHEASEPALVAFDLAELTPGRPFAGMATGEFVDMNGREITIDRADLKAFIANTRALIADFQRRGMPGLPIDARKHDKADAAGWITGVEDDIVDVEDSNGGRVPVIRLLAEWTPLGVRLLENREFANFSPTLDPTKKVIRGGSLTNWPASVDEAGVPLFEAVELAQGIYTLSEVDERGAEEAPPALTHSEGETDMGDKEERHDTPEQGGDAPAITVSQEQLNELVSERVNAALAELDNDRNSDGQMVELAQLAEAFGLDTGAAEEVQLQHLDQLAKMVEEQANLKWQQKLAEMQRQRQYAELAQQVTGGTPEAPRGIPAEADTVKAELMKLTPEQAKFWGGLLRTITRSGLTDYAELGHGKRTETKRELPAEYATALDAGDLSVADLSDPILAPDLGDVARYDLSKWED